MTLVEALIVSALGIAFYVQSGRLLAMLCSGRW